MLGSRSQCGKLLKGKFAINLKEPKISTKESLKNVTAKKNNRTTRTGRKSQAPSQLQGKYKVLSTHHATTIFQGSFSRDQQDIQSLTGNNSIVEQSHNH